MQAQNAVNDSHDPARSGRLDSSTLYVSPPENLRSPAAPRPESGAMTIHAVCGGN